MLEKAILINFNDKIKLNELKKYNRVYLGSNFCSNIPIEISYIKKLYENGIRKITIATSLLTDKGIKKTISLIKKLNIEKIYPEISTLDIGLIYLLRRKRIKNSILLSIPLSHDFGRMDINSVMEFIKKYKIKYIETDEEYIVKKFSKIKFNVSYHYPFEYLSMTRFCPYEFKISNNCSYSCKNKILKLRKIDDNSDNFIYLKENAYFKLNKMLKFHIIKRIVKTYYEYKEIQG